LEFLYDDATGAYYFIEMNTRIQVEHPVTEMVTGFDLVAAMIRIAGGEPLGIAQDDIRLSGHAIECRINAENPAMDFLPNPGPVTAYRAPEGPGVRFDTMLYEGYEIPPFYDSLLGKLIVHAENREAALDRVAAALTDLTVEGIHTTIPLHQQLAGDADIRAGRFHTQFLEPWLEANPIPSD
jgi:acetyl-CoA carboxylase biotin carboxylase subunit